jgi:hypothetical protein
MENRYGLLHWHGLGIILVQGCLGINLSRGSAPLSNILLRFEANNSNRFHILFSLGVELA